MTLEGEGGDPVTVVACRGEYAEALLHWARATTHGTGAEKA